MASSSPAPNSSPTAVPPTSNNPPPAAPPTSTPSTPSPLRPQSPPSSTPTPPPQPPPSTPPPASPPSQSPPSPPPTTSSPPPPVISVPPPSTPPPLSPPPVSPNPPVSSQPPSSPSPPASSPPPPSSPNPPARSPSPSSPNPPASSPPPRSSPNPPASSPPPPSSPNPPARSPPQPTSSPPSPSSNPPSSSPPPQNPPPPSPQPPGRSPPPSQNSPPPSRSTPPPPASPSPPSANPPNSSSPPIVLASPPPPLGVSPSPSQVLVPPSSNPTNNDSSPNTPSGNGGIGTGGVVTIGLVIGFVLLSVIGVAAWCMKKRRRKVAGGGHIMPTSLSSGPTSDSVLIKVQTSADQTGSSSATEFAYTPQEPGGLRNSRSWFTYDELVEATDGFSAQNLLGEGGFGSVYKGHLGDGTEVAVKQLKIGGGQGEREFKAEVEIIGRIHHRHLVSLVGYCISENRRLLVYDYVPNNTLYFHLHGSDRLVMDWATRVKVAAGASRGIAYLHEDCHPRIIHRDIKSSNILLDKNFKARVSDFGLAKLAVNANSHITTRVMGTFGYMAPEYASSGRLTEKSDVYSFGVVLLELITGRKPVDASQPLGDESLVEWARPLLSHSLETQQFEGLVDPRLENNYVDSEMFRMIEAAAACVRHSAAKRPRMGQVVRAFDSMAAEDLTNGMRVGESEIFNSAQQSEEIKLFRRMAFGSQDYSTDFFSQDSWHS